MAELKQFEFIVVRYMPTVVRQLSVNIGVLLCEHANEFGFVGARFCKDWREAKRLNPDVDTNVLESFRREIESQWIDSSQRPLLLRRFHDACNGIQMPEVQRCLGLDGADELARQYDLFVKAWPPQVITRGGLAEIHRGMNDEFRAKGILRNMIVDFPIAQFTKEGDPFTFDFGYNVGTSIKFFQAVSMSASVDKALLLAARYPVISTAIKAKKGANTFLTAIVNNGLEDQTTAQFGIGMMKDAKIRVATLSEMPAIAEEARIELNA